MTNWIRSSKYPLDVVTRSWNKQPNVRCGRGLWPRAGEWTRRQGRYLLPPEAELQGNTSPSQGAGMATELAQLHRQPEKSSRPLGFPQKGHSFPSSPVPSTSLLGQLRALLPTTDICRWLFCKKLLLTSLPCADFCFTAEGHFSYLHVWKVCAHTHTHICTHTQRGTSRSLGTSIFSTGLKHNSAVSPHFMNKNLGGKHLGRRSHRAVLALTDPGCLSQAERVISWQ